MCRVEEKTLPAIHILMIEHKSFSRVELTINILMELF